MELIDLLIAYTANSTTASHIADILDKDEEKVKNILVEFQNKWDNAECDPE